jgi:phage gpG-like protein
MITITVDDKTAVTIANIQDLPTRLAAQIASTMTWVLIDLQSYIVLQKLQGQVLHHRSGHLGKSIVYRQTQDTAGEHGIVGVGLEAPYGFIHEFGGVYTIPTHLAHWVNGPPLGQIRTASWTVNAHAANFPERSFMRSALSDKAESIRTKFAKDIAAMMP